jgi:hypothetical protein
MMTLPEYLVEMHMHEKHKLRILILGGREVLCRGQVVEMMIK